MTGAERESAVGGNRIYVREAAATLLKMAKTTSDPGLAARLIEAAVNLQEKAGELPVPPKTADVA